VENGIAIFSEKISGTQLEIPIPRKIHRNVSFGDEECGPVCV
jgi:hypothetical protein